MISLQSSGLSSWYTSGHSASLSQCDPLGAIWRAIAYMAEPGDIINFSDCDDLSARRRVHIIIAVNCFCESCSVLRGRMHEMVVILFVGLSVLGWLKSAR